MAHIKKYEGKRGISYQARVKIRGRIRTKTFARKTDAKAWAAQIESDLNGGRYVPTGAEERRTVTDTIDRYIKQVLPNKRRNKDQANPRQRLLWWRAQIGGYRLVDVTPELIADCRDRLAHTRAPATCNRYLAALSAIYKPAIRQWRWVRENPVRLVEPLEEPAGRTRYATTDEVQRLLAACRQSRNRHLFPIVVLLLATGVRLGGIRKLRWGQVDFARKTITLPDSKNGDPQCQPLAGVALEVLKAHRKIRRLDSDLVFPGRNPQRPVEIHKAWSYALERAEIQNFRPHDCRHTTASHMAMSGATARDIMEVLGHRSLQMTARYSHLADGHVRGVIDEAAATIFGHGSR